MRLREKTCPVCRKTFQTAHYKRKYCSIECRARARVMRYGVDYDETLERLKRLLENPRQKPGPKPKQEPPKEPVTGEEPGMYTRGAPVAWRCVSCGKPSATYRCPKCKAKWLKKNGVAPCEEGATDDRYRIIV